MMPGSLLFALSLSLSLPQGTLMNVLLIGPSLYLCGYFGLFNGIQIPMIECLVFSTLISAVDPVAVSIMAAMLTILAIRYFN